MFERTLRDGANDRFDIEVKGNDFYLTIWTSDYDKDENFIYNLNSIILNKGNLDEFVSTILEAYEYLEGKPYVK